MHADGKALDTQERWHLQVPDGRYRRGASRGSDRSARSGDPGRAWWAARYSSPAQWAGSEVTTRSGFRRDPTELDGADVIEDAGAAATTPAPARPRTQKRIRTPDLDADLHPAETPSFKAYAEARNVTVMSPVLRKFLIVAAWLHEERSGMKITADRAYTCFRFIEWPFNIDFDQPL